MRYSTKTAYVFLVPEELGYAEGFEKYCNIVKQMDTASIEEMISQEYPASGNVMIDAIDIIQREGVRSVTIITGDNAKLILKSKGDGLLVRKQKIKSEEVLN